MLTKVKDVNIQLAYFEFLRAARKVRTAAGAPQLDANEEALLNELTLHWAVGKPLAVRAAMELNQLGSPSTLHRRIARLKVAGLIEDLSAPGNLRIKRLAPTKRALSYFEKLSKAVASAGE